MSTFMFITNFHEIEIDNDLNVIDDYDFNLPHHDIIAANAEKSWNEMHMEQFYDGFLKDKVESAKMKCRVNKDGESEGVILIKMKKGVRLTEKCRNAIVEQTSAQLSDGWGESFFGPINIMTDGHTRFYVE